ncbi:MAG TPA: pilus assembly protein N-terminal domain-containing protein [Methylomirabilota bacterium]|nr:pilus assembly protein N-terminal domain-containing protein [Methylomirabilota bacterium]
MNKETRMGLPRFKQSRLALGALGLGLATVLAMAGPTGAQEQTAVFVAFDQATVLTVGPEPLTKVVVASPNVADVQVLNPSQLLLTGKAVGRTTLLLIFAGNKQRQYDLVVHPSAALPAPTTPASPEPYSVLVHRGDQVSQRFFLRDRSDAWIELGTVKDTEAPKK